MVETRASRSRNVLILAILSSCTLLVLGGRLDPIRSRVRDVLAPVRQLGDRATAPFDNAAAIATGKAAELQKENDRLRKELDDARAASLRYQDAVRERRELLALSNFVDPDGLRTVEARVTGGALNNFDETIEINRGSSSGVTIDSPVVTGAGLVGRVASMTSGTSTVELITDPSSSVGVRLSKSGDVGVARGQHRGEPLEIGLIDLDTKVGAKEVLVTSGLDRSRFPAGIPVATVRTVRTGSVQQRVTAVPVVDLEHASFVKVLIPAKAA